MGGDYKRNKVKVKVAQSCLTLGDPMDYTWIPTQGSNPGLAHCGRILYQLSHREAQEYWSG